MSSDPMTRLNQEFFRDYKKLFPGMNLEMVSIFSRIMMMFHHLPILMEGYFKKMGLTKSRFMVLIQLYRKGGEGLSVHEMCDFHQVRSATMTGIVDTLEREGQIERVPDAADRRKVIVRITGKGKELMETFLPMHQAQITKMLAGLNKTERRNLLELLMKLYRGVSKVVENDSPVVKGRE